MLTLVNILIIFFLFIIMYQIFLAMLPIVEGLENQYEQYDTNNPNNALILAQQNAGNIAYLKERLDDYQGAFQELQDLSGNVVSLQNQVNGLVQAQQDYANQMTGGTPPVITGTTDTDTDTDTNTNTT